MNELTGDELEVLIGVMSQQQISVANDNAVEAMRVARSAVVKLQSMLEALQPDL